MTPRFYKKYCDEVVAYVSEEALTDKRQDTGGVQPCATKGGSERARLGTARHAGRQNMKQFIFLLVGAFLFGYYRFPVAVAQVPDNEEGGKEFVRLQDATQKIRAARFSDYEGRLGVRVDCLRVSCHPSITSEHLSVGAAKRRESVRMFG